MQTTLDQQKLEYASYLLNCSANCQDFHDLRLALVPNDLSCVMLEALQRLDGTKPKPTLILYHLANGERCKIQELLFCGPSREYSWLKKLCIEPAFQDDFEMSLNRDKALCLFSARIKQADTNIDSLVSWLLSCLLITGRPLRYYGCTFYLPLDLRLDEELQENKDSFERLINTLGKSSSVERHQYNYSEESKKFSSEDKETPAYLYFLPHLRDFIIDTGTPPPDKAAIKPVEHWRLRSFDIEKMKLKLGSIDDKAEQNPLTHVTAKVSDVSLYRYYNNVLLFALSVELIDPPGENSSLIRDNETWWYDLINLDNKENQKNNYLQSLQLSFRSFFVTLNFLTIS